MRKLAEELNCNMCAYDYSGYGLSTGSPRESNLYADIQAVWTCLTTRHVAFSVTCTASH